MSNSNGGEAIVTGDSLYDERLIEELHKINNNKDFEEDVLRKSKPQNKRQRDDDDEDDDSSSNSSSISSSDNDNQES